MTKMNVESFNLDHTKVVAPFVRLAGTMEGLNGDVIKSMTFALNNLTRAHGNAWVTLTRAFNG